MHLPVLAGAVGLAPLRALRWRSVACCRSRYDMLTRSLSPGSPDTTRSLTAVRLLHSVYYSTLMLALRQTAPAARGRQLPPTRTPPCQDPLPARAPNPHAYHDTDSRSLPPVPARLSYPPTYISLTAYTLRGWRVSEIKRQTESCPTRVSEDTGALFATPMSRKACGSECPLTDEKKADKTGHVL